MQEFDKQTKENLTSLDRRINMGFDRSIIMTSEKVHRASIYTEKVIIIFTQNFIQV